MVGAAWQDFRAELALWQESGNPVEFWWRDDDAGPSSAELGRLLALASKKKVPIALAVIPDRADRAAFTQMDAQAAVIQHGSDHRNRAGPSGKKTEFPEAEPVDEALKRLAEGRRKLEDAAGGLVVPVLAPPWNRLAPALVPRLLGAGYVGLSRFGVRKVTNSAGALAEINTHVDIINWKGARGFCGLEQALGQALRHLAARRLGTADASEPTGWLTHHAVHDEGAWNFLADLFDVTRGLDGVTWRSSIDLFGARARS
jgi:hypothetical protein